MQFLKLTSDLRDAVSRARQSGLTIGLVPTMGALHAGHGALIDRARADCGCVIVTIFVNPLQFDRKDDYERYARNLPVDLEFCRERGADFVFAPDADEIYPGPQRVFVDAPSLAEHLCGAHRPGHFQGVATVVTKLLNMAQPDRAYFGEKDAQQLAIVQALVADLNMAIQIVPVPTVRESDGLAISSRNARLGQEERRSASTLYRALGAAAASVSAGAGPYEVREAGLEVLHSQPMMRVEYLDIVDPESMRPVDEIRDPVRIAAAVWLGETRLIDNVLADAPALPSRDRQGAVSRNEVATLLTSLVRINSINPSLVPTGPGEATIARFVKSWLNQRGIPSELDEAAPGRHSIIARVKGSGGGRSLLLNAHLDTVGVSGMTDPFAGRASDGRLYGRGSYDMKGSLAACMLALSDIRPGDLKGDVLLTAVADEEYASLGTQSVLRHITADAAIVTEPTALQVCVAHKGFSWHEFTTHGRSAHGSRPDLGIDAIAHMGHILTRLENLQDELRRRPAHPLLGHASVHASIIAGGQELSSYPEACTLQVERRTLPGETIAAVEQEFETILKDLRASQRTVLVRPPFSVPEDAPIVEALRNQASQIVGQPPAVIGQTFWMDAAFLSAAGIPTVVFGPDGAGAHAAEEWVDLGSVAACRHVLTATIRAFCQ
jgi:acetylornithine deacetylase